MKPVTIYRYYEAPKIYQISHNGGDEDFVVVGDYELARTIADKLAVCDSEEYQTEDGTKFFITCHA